MKTKLFLLCALMLCVIALVACAAPAPTATPVPPTPTAIPPTSTPTPVPPTATVIPPTPNLEPKFTPAPTPIPIPPMPAPTSRPPMPGDFVVIAAGDTQSGCNAAAQQTASLLDVFPSDTLILHGGDMTDNGAPSEYNDCFNLTWGRHKSQIRPVPGNHDYLTLGASGYYDYFGALAGTRDQGYYSFNLSAWHIVALNTEIDYSASSAQVEWLKSDLAATTSQCILAYWHKPRFSSGFVHGSETSVAPLWDVLYAARVDVVFNGHEHGYERFAKQNPSGEPDANGIREFVIATGGGRLYGQRALLANTEVRNATTYGIGKFTLRAGSYDWQFIPVAGQTFTDSGTAPCNPK